MHFMLTLHAENGDDTIIEKVVACLDGHPHHQVFPYCYVVQVAGFGIYERLHVALRESAASIDETTVRFLLSPLMPDAAYRGRIDAATAEALPPLSESAGDRA